jgi:ubiquinone/menaquinone biosynthesis C-methylase UbiE
MNDPTNAAGGGFPETADIETSSDDYARRFAGRTGAWMLEIQERITRRLMSGFPNATVLDVGGGHGQLAVPLCRAGWQVTVLGSAESCRKRVAEVVDSGMCRFVVGNAILLPFPDKSFDVAISFRLLTHCDAWPQLVREFCRVARRAVIVDYPTSQSLNAAAPALFGAKRKLEGNTRQWTLFRHEQILGEFRRNGFELGAREAEFFFPMVLHRALRCRVLSRAMERLASLAGLTGRWGSPVIVRMEREA